MEELKDIQQQKKLLEKQLAELQYKESRLERKEKALISVDDNVYITRSWNSWYELQIRVKSTDEEISKHLLDNCSTCIISTNLKDLETEMLCLIQRLLDATIQLGKLEK